MNDEIISLTRPDSQIVNSSRIDPKSEIKYPFETIDLHLTEYCIILKRFSVQEKLIYI